MLTSRYMLTSGYMLTLLPAGVDRTDHNNPQQPQVCQLSDRCPAATTGLQLLPDGGEAPQVSERHTRAVKIAQK